LCLRKRSFAQSRKGAKRCRASKGFLCAFAPLRERNLFHNFEELPENFDKLFREKQAQRAFPSFSLK